MGWNRRRARALGRAVGVLAVGLAVALLAVPSGVVGASVGGPPGSPAAPPTVAPFAPGKCGGQSEYPNLTGTLGVQGGPAPAPSVANRTIEVAFDYLENFSSHGGTPTFQCLARNVTAATGSGGAFTADMTLPGGSGCVGSTCVYFTGPFAPVSLGVAGAPPSGYFVTSRLVGSSATVDFVAALNATTLTPYGRTTVSVNAPVTLTAQGLAGNGAPSPATLTYAWTVSGSGWTLVSGAGTSSLVVDSSTAQSLGLVTVYVNGTYGTATQSAPIQQAQLTPVATATTGEDVFPTTLDVGTPTTFTVNGTGAVGYTYVGEIAPGLNAGSVTAPCTSSPLNGGLLALSCTVTLAYRAAGTATPSAVLTNGYSAAPAVAYPSITVAPTLAIFVTPQPDLAYAGRPTTITVSVAMNTGTAPYGRACDWPGNGNLTCSGGGPTWTFTTRYGLAQTYVGHVTVADAGGANVSVVTTTTVAQAPYLANFSETNGSIPLGQPFLLTSDYAGGALPASYWWNESIPGASGTNTLAAGTLLRDGPMNLSWTPTETGRHLVTLQVMDGLRTLGTAWFNTTVVAGPAARVAASAGGIAWTAAAGHALNVSWTAVDAWGYRTSLDLPNVTIAAVAGSSATLEHLNDSIAGPILPVSGGEFVLNASDWHNGFLNFSIESRTAGTLGLLAISRLPLDAFPNGRATLVVTPDYSHVRLSAPSWQDPSASYGPNDTRWTIADWYGNPIATGTVAIYTDFGGTTASTNSSVVPGGGAVWVNFTIPYGVGGTVRVVSEWTAGVLWSATVPGPGATALIDYALPLGLLALAVVGLGVAVRGRRPPAAPRTASETPTTGDDPLLRLAQGRAHVLARADPVEPRGLAELVRGWAGHPPDPAELTEWVSSLVAEGVLRAAVGPDGLPVFVRTPPGTPPPTDAPPRIEIDAAALEAALAHRPTPEPGENPDEGAAPPGGSG